MYLTPRKLEKAIFSCFSNNKLLTKIKVVTKDEASKFIPLLSNVKTSNMVSNVTSQCQEILMFGTTCGIKKNRKKSKHQAKTMLHRNTKGRKQANNCNSNPMSLY